MLSAQKKSRNYFIELLRFFFAVLILLYHGLAFLAPDSSFLRCTNGAVAVEFFFILSGFLMANSAKKKIGDTANIGKDSVDFIKKKYLSVFPYHLFSYVCSFIVAVILGSLTVVGAVKLFVNSLPNLFMLDMVGLPYTMVAGYVWFVSAMLIAMAVLYPILRRWFSVFTNIIAPVLGVLLLGWLAQTYGRLTYISFWTGLTFKGVLRAVAEIAFGCAAFALCERLKERDFTKFGKLVLSLLELFGYAATFVYAFFQKIRNLLFLSRVFLNSIYCRFVLRPNADKPPAQQQIGFFPRKAFFAGLSQSILCLFNGRALYKTFKRKCPIVAVCGHQSRHGDNLSSPR